MSVKAQGWVGVDVWGRVVDGFGEEGEGPNEAQGKYLMLVQEVPEGESHSQLLEREGGREQVWRGGSCGVKRLLRWLRIVACCTRNCSSVATHRPAQHLQNTRHSPLLTARTHHPPAAAPEQPALLQPRRPGLRIVLPGGARVAGHVALDHPLQGIDEVVVQVPAGAVGWGCCVSIGKMGVGVGVRVGRGPDGVGFAPCKTSASADRLAPPSPPSVTTNYPTPPPLSFLSSPPALLPMHTCRSRPPPACLPLQTFLARPPHPASSAPVLSLPFLLSPTPCTPVVPGHHRPHNSCACPLVPLQPHAHGHLSFQATTTPPPSPECCPSPSLISLQPTSQALFNPTPMRTCRSRPPPACRRA